VWGSGLDVARGRWSGELEPRRRRRTESDHEHAHRRVARDAGPVGGDRARGKRYGRLWSRISARTSASTFCCSGCRLICITPSTFPLARVGHYSIIPWIATFLTISFSGWLADALIARGLSVGTVRKGDCRARHSRSAATALLIVPAAKSPAMRLRCSRSRRRPMHQLRGLRGQPSGRRADLRGNPDGHLEYDCDIPGIIGVAATGLIVQTTKSFSAVFYLIAAVTLSG